jgi:RimJ/RimL family protein N-acetyltransferase
MEERRNELGQPIGFPLPGWRRPPHPPREALSGRLCRVEPLDPARHADQLWDAYALDADARHWTYLPYGPFADRAAYRDWVEAASGGDDPLFFAVVDVETRRAVGVASWLRIDPANGCIEVGHLRFSSLLQRRPAATEAMYLMMRRAFELGYRRYEWKCDALNAPLTRRGAAARALVRGRLPPGHRHQAAEPRHRVVRGDRSRRARPRRRVPPLARPRELRRSEPPTRAAVRADGAAPRPARRICLTGGALAS